MDEQVFAYCERGTSPDFWAEPFNAATNAAFLLAALVGLVWLMRLPREHRSADHFLLLFLIVLIGAGSFAFHTLATRAAGLADVVPISVFMLIYLGFALNRFLNVPPGWTVLAVGLFAALCFVSMRIDCADGAISFGAPDGDESRCLNGSIAYLPALAALVGIGIVMHMRRHAAARYVLWAAAVFLVSLTFRTLDMELCDATVFGGRAIGTHFVWHTLNAVVLLLLLRASYEARPSSSN